MQILGCQTTDLKMFSIAKSACLRYIMCKNLKNFPGAAPPDPCRSSIGALMRTSLARSAALRAASRRARFARRRPRIPRQGAAEHLPKVFLGAGAGIMSHL